MGDDADRFRQRARDCRALAKNAKSPEWRDALEQIATDLENEADMLDAEEPGKN